MAMVVGGYFSSSNLYYGNIVKNGKGIYMGNSDIVYNNTITQCTQGICIAQGSHNVIVGNTITYNSGPGCNSKLCAR